MSVGSMVVKIHETMRKFIISNHQIMACHEWDIYGAINEVTFSFGHQGSSKYRRPLVVIVLHQLYVNEYY